jgi:hypothetical protein
MLVFCLLELVYTQSKLVWEIYTLKAFGNQTLLILNLQLK